MIFETEHFTIAQDFEVPIQGFLIVSSKKHIHSILELNEKEHKELIEILFLARKAIESLNISNEVTIIQEERASHLHFWLFPWHTWMESKFEKGISSLRNICEYAVKNASFKEKQEALAIANTLKQNLSKEKK